MRTEHLVKAIAADLHREPSAGKLLPRALAAAAGLVTMIALPVIGLRTDLIGLLVHWNVLLKHVFPLLLVLGGFGAVLRLAIPGESVGKWPLVLALVPMLLAGAVAVELWLVPASGWKAAMMGQSQLACLTAIPLMSVPILAASLWALRQGASTQPMLSGAMAGLMSGGAATAIYAIHCFEDSPLFYGSWYLAGILIAALIGAVAGRRVLAW